MATKANISIDQGTTFSTSISLSDDSGNQLNLGGYTAQAQIRTWYTSVNSISFQTSLSNGNIILSLDANTTSLLTRPRYVYDVVLTDASNNITRVVEGVIYVDPAITRPQVIPTYYTLLLANVQASIFDGDLVYQSNGSANVVGTVYYTEGPPLLGFGYSLANTANTIYMANDTANVMMIKVSDPSGQFILTGNNNNFLLYDSNTSANAIVLSVTQSITEQ